MSINDHIRTKLSSADKKAKKERHKQIDAIIDLSKTFLVDEATPSERHRVACVLVDQHNALEHIKNQDLNKALGILHTEAEESDGFSDRRMILMVVDTLERRFRSRVSEPVQVAVVG